MSKSTIIVLPVVLVLLGSSVFAQGTSSQIPAGGQQAMKNPYGSPGAALAANPLMNKEKIEKFIQSLMEIGLLYKMLEQPTMVSTDNGIVVAYGNTLRKYDKDLNLVKEVDLDVNVDGMQDLAAKFAKKYSSDFMDLMGGMTGAPSASSSVSSSVSPSATAADPSKSLEDQHEAEIKKEIADIK
jgi:hypothetical protein